jgi:hypothetical protein
MKCRRFAILACLLVLAAGVSFAADSRTYQRTIEPVWDEAVKAARDAELIVTDSSRAKHWFTMKTKPTTFSRSIHFEVELRQSGEVTTVTVSESDHQGSKKSRKVISRYFAALHDRMN